MREILVALSILATVNLVSSSMTQMYINMGKRTALKILNNTVGDSQCGNDLRFFIDALIETETWALEMLDASDKIAAGYLTGNVRQSGSYDECLAVRAIGNDTRIMGKYCLYGIFSNVTGEKNIFNIKKQLALRGIKYEKVEPYLNGIKASSSVCIPSSCSAEDLQLIWNYTQWYFSLSIELKFNETYCDYDGRVPFQNIDFLSIIFFSTIALVVMASTSYDILVQHRKKTPQNLWTAFSFYSNGLRLFSLNSKEDTLDCVHGIRVISMMWIILCHGFMFHMFIPNINGVYIFDWKNHFENMIILGGTVAVDTFFVLSGLFVVYVFLMTNEKRGSVNLISFYLHRILRLTPSLGAILLNLMTLFKYFSAGPYWHIIFNYVDENCKKYWWTTLLYIQNYYDPTDQCVPHGWYLSVDMQLYFLAPLVLYPLLKWPKKTIALICLLISMAMIAAFCNTWIMELGAMPYEPKNSYFRYIYQATYYRASTWLIGGLLGYVLFQLKHTEVVMDGKTNICLWMMSLGVMVSVIFGQIIFIKYDYDVLKAATFNAIGRPAWACALCYIIFACVKDHGGIVNTFLSLPIFQVISRLTYSMYLMHLGVLGININARRTVAYFSNITMLHDFWGDFAFTVLYSIGWTLVFESPIIAIEKMYTIQNGSTRDGKENRTIDVIDILAIPDDKRKTINKRND